MKFKLVLALCVLFTLNAGAQKKSKKEDKGYRIEVNAPKSAGSYVHLVKHHQGSTYSIDSIPFSTTGKAVFESKEKLPQGQYIIFKRPDIEMELLIGDEQSNIKLDLNENNLTDSKITGSKDTQLFWEYIRNVNNKTQEITELRKQLEKESKPEDKNQIENKISSLEDALQNYMQSQAKLHEKEWFGVFLKGSLPITLPIKNVTTQQEAQQNKEYMMKHFFDNVSFTDPRFWRTNYFPEMVDTYLYKWVVQIPDTVAKEASRLVALSQGNETSFQEMLSRLLNNAMQSKYMGMENVWSKLAEDYIFDKNISWIDSAQVLQIKAMYEPLKYNRIGMKAHNIKLATINGDTINTNEIDAQFTIIYFFNPTCNHCRKVTPLLRDNIYEKYKDKGVRVVAIDIDNNATAWKNYIEENKITEWYNCSDPNYKSGYWMYYDTSSVPFIYVLDKDKNIIARRVDGENLERLLGYYIR